MQGLGCPSINFSDKACHPLPTIHIYMYMVNRNHMNLCLQASADLLMFGSQIDQNIARILILDDLLMFCQAFGVNLVWYVCCWRGLHVY